MPLEATVTWGGEGALTSNQDTPTYRLLDFEGKKSQLRLSFLIYKMGIKVIPTSQLFSCQD